MPTIDSSLKEKILSELKLNALVSVDFKESEVTPALRAKIADKLIDSVADNLVKLLEQERREARKLGYNSGWTARDRTKPLPKKVICPVCKTVSDDLSPLLDTKVRSFDGRLQVPTSSISDSKAKK